MYSVFVGIRRYIRRMRAHGLPSSLREIKPDRRTDEQTNRRTDEQTNRQTDKQTSRRTDEQTNRRTDEQTIDSTPLHPPSKLRVLNTPTKLRLRQILASAWRHRVVGCGLHILYLTLQMVQETGNLRKKCLAS